MERCRDACQEVGEGLQEWVELPDEDTDLPLQLKGGGARELLTSPLRLLPVPEWEHHAEDLEGPEDEDHVVSIDSYREWGRSLADEVEEVRPPGDNKDSSGGRQQDCT